MCRQALQCCTAKGGKDRARSVPIVIPCVQKKRKKKHLGDRRMNFLYRTQPCVMRVMNIKNVNVNNPQDTGSFSTALFLIAPPHKCTKTFVTGFLLADIESIWCCAAPDLTYQVESFPPFPQTSSAFMQRSQ